MKNTYIIVAIIVIVGLGFFFFTNKTETPSSTTPPASVGSLGTSPAGETPADFNDTPQTGDTPILDSAVAIVTYTNEGFSPKETTISKGQTVRFVNESSNKMWVGSVIHPAHAAYPEKTAGDCLGSAFDQCTANTQGESWEFTFNEIGSWGFHNHVRARDTGVVIVK